MRDPKGWYRSACDGVLLGCDHHGPSYVDAIYSYTSVYINVQVILTVRKSFYDRVTMPRVLYLLSMLIFLKFADDFDSASPSMM